MLKEFIWKLMGNQIQRKYKQMLFEHTQRYEKFKNRTKGKCAYLLLDTPRHGNLGDQAIALAEIDFMRKYFPEEAFYEFSHDECKYCIDDIYRYTSRNHDTIMIHGGGFIGSLWMSEHLNFLQILNVFKTYKIVIFPQTIYFESSFAGEQLAAEFESELLACKDITFFVRDERSYAWLDQRVRERPNIKYALVPDIVTSLQHGIEPLEQKKEVLLCMRSDQEKSFSDQGLSQVTSWLKKQGYSIVKTNTVINKTIAVKSRRKYVLCKLQQFSSCSLVITDRLHGMIFSAITETPCIAMDNISKKVSGGYKWFKDLPYIRQVEDDRIMLEEVKEMLHVQNVHYDMQRYAEYYELIRQAVKRDKGMFRDIKKGKSCP